MQYERYDCTKKLKILLKVKTVQTMFHFSEHSRIFVHIVSSRLLIFVQIKI